MAGLKKPNFQKNICLFLSEEDPDRHTLEIKPLPQLIFQVILVWCFDIVGVVGEEGK
jgi:hypothetical protein